MVREKKVNEKIILLLVMVLTVLMSKTVFFGIINKQTFQYIYYLAALVGSVKFGARKKQLRNNFAMAAPMIMLMLANMFLYSYDMSESDKNLVLGYILIIIAAVLVSSYITQQEFADTYIRIMSVICVISLACCFIANTNEALARSLCQKGYDWRIRFGYSFYYTWGWNGTIFSRNSGPFWEPGAFQGFILLAVLMLVYNKDEGTIKKRRLTFALLLVAMLTTQSSTGYILVIVLFVTHWNRLDSLFGNTKKIIRYFLIIAMGAAAIYYIINSGNISDKLSGADTESAATRFEDMSGGLKLILKGGLLGLGETATKTAQRALMGVSVNDSVGLFFLTYTFGILCGLWYLYCLLLSIKHMFKPKNPFNFIALVVIFIILHMTEGLWFLALYMTFLFVGIDGNIKLNKG